MYDSENSSQITICPVTRADSIIAETLLTSSKYPFVPHRQLPADADGDKHAPQRAPLPGRPHLAVRVPLRHEEVGIDAGDGEPFAHQLPSAVQQTLHDHLVGALGSHRDYRAAQ